MGLTGRREDKTAGNRVFSLGTPKHGTRGSHGLEGGTWEVQQLVRATSSANMVVIAMVGREHG